MGNGERWQGHKKTFILAQTIKFKCTNNVYIYAGLKRKTLKDLKKDNLKVITFITQMLADTSVVDGQEHGT